MNETVNIEQLLRESYLNGRAPVPEHAWKKLRYRLIWLNFIRSRLKWLSLTLLLLLLASFIIWKNQEEISSAGQINTRQTTDVAANNKAPKATVSETNTNITNVSDVLKPHETAKPSITTTLQNTDNDLQEPPNKPTAARQNDFTLFLPPYPSVLSFKSDHKLTYPSVENKVAWPDSAQSITMDSELPSTVENLQTDTSQSISKQTVTHKNVLTEDTVNHIKNEQNMISNAIVIENTNKTNPTNSTSAIQHSISFSAGTSYSFINLSGPEEYPDHTFYRKSQELSGPGAEVALEWTAAINNWTLTSGVIYNVSRRHASYQIETPMTGPGSFYYTYDTTFAWIYDPPQIAYQIIVSIDSTFIQRMKTLKWNGWRSYSFLEIPLFAGYKGNVGKTGWETSLGIKAVFPIAVHGKLPAPDNTELWQEAAIKNALSPVSIHFGIRCALTRPLTYKLLLFTEISATLNSNPYKKEVYPINEKSYTAGLKIGIRYQLSNP